MVRVETDWWQHTLGTDDPETLPTEALRDFIFKKTSAKSAAGDDR